MASLSTTAAGSRKPCCRPWAETPEPRRAMPKITTDGFTMHYEVHGSGENRGAPVLCIMGITAPGSVWSDHVAAWSGTFRCITPDNRGVGESDKPEGAYTTAMMADDHARLLD